MTKTITSPKAFLQRLVLGSSSKNLKKTLGLGALALGLALIAATTPNYLRASDHDDGETDTKGRNLNLTDLFVFREKDQPGGSGENLVFIMNTNPRSMPRQPYYFSNRARYEFKVMRVTDKNASPTTAYENPNITLRFEFGEPTGNNPFKQQPITLTVIRDGRQVGNPVNVGQTTPVNSNNPIVNNVTVGGAPVSVFAGLREDPHFFDVEQFFRVRAAALGFGTPPPPGTPETTFRPRETAIDDFKDVNVNAIAVRVPISLLQGSSPATTASTFDVWETISVPSGNGNAFTQVERLARPAVNEGLLVSNDYLNALNMVGPDFEAAALSNSLPQTSQPSPVTGRPRTLAEIITARGRGNQPPAQNGSQQAQAIAILGEANRTLLALGNDQARATALVGAFLPDVMRIDTTQESNYDIDIPATCVNTKGSPICGRKLDDDVVDLTLRVLTNNPAATDNVFYNGTPGNPAQGHKPLTTSFPYLALPN